MALRKRIKRSELYQLVWQEPMSRLAKTFAISDVGLAKICRKHNVPSPPRGYWAKKQHGQEPRQIPLPKSAKDDEIVIRDPSDVELSHLNPNSESAERLLAEKKEPKIEVAESLRGAHDLVRQANEQLQSARTDDDGKIVRPEKPVLDISTSKSSLRRSLLLIDAVLKALDRRGYAVQAGPAAKIMGATVRFSISEQLETKREPADEHDLEGPYQFGFNRFKENRLPSGKLTLKIDMGGPYWLNGCRHTWRDTDKQKLEDRLNQFVAGLIEVASKIKQHEEEEKKRAELRAQEELRRQEAARQLAEKRQLYKEEKARFDFLLTQAKDWQTSKLIRELIETARDAYSAAGPIQPDSKIAAWIEWATKQADRLDPLKPSPPSILDEQIPEEVPQQQGYSRRW